MLDSLIVIGEKPDVTPIVSQYEPTTCRKEKRGITIAGKEEKAVNCSLSEAISAQGRTSALCFDRAQPIKRQSSVPTSEARSAAAID
jgi:hypothetical protein